MSTNLNTVLQERESTHGKYCVHAHVTQGLKQVLRDYQGFIRNPMNEEQKESIDMIFHKIGRIVAGDPNHHDHWLDICGYAKLIVTMLEEKHGQNGIHSHAPHQGS